VNRDDFNIDCLNPTRKLNEVEKTV